MVSKLRRASYHEVVGYWIDYEYADRKDFRDYIHAHFSHDNIKYILQPQDYGDPVANRMRLAMLTGYRRFISWFGHADWWLASLSKSDIMNLLVIYSPHWYLLSSGSLRALDVAKGIDEKRWKKPRIDPMLVQPQTELDHIKAIAREESKKISSALKKKVKSKRPTRVVVIGAEGGNELTVIDGVHRAVRLCLYYGIDQKGKDKQFSQQAYVGLTPNPIRHSRRQWQDVDEFFARYKMLRSGQER